MLFNAYQGSSNETNSDLILVSQLSPEDISQAEFRLEEIGPEAITAAVTRVSIYDRWNCKCCLGR